MAALLQTLLARRDGLIWLGQGSVGLQGSSFTGEIVLWAVRGFKTLKKAYATMRCFEVMHALRKGQAGAFNITRDIGSETPIVERAFSIGASALSEYSSYSTRDWNTK